MDVDDANSYLVTGDNFGFICVWNIEGYALEKAETDSPMCKSSDVSLTSKQTFGDESCVTVFFESAKQLNLQLNAIECIRCFGVSIAFCG